MARYRQIHVSFWQDSFVLRITPEDKYFYLYIMTNPKTSACGVYELPKQVIAFETGYNLETVNKLIARFEEYGKIKYDHKTEEIFIVNWLDHNEPKSELTRKCISNEIMSIKNNEFVNILNEKFRLIGYPLQGACKPLPSNGEGYGERNGEGYGDGDYSPEPETGPGQFITLTLNDKSEHPIFESQIAEWQELYPAVDIRQELRNMKGWCNSNPTKRKTSRGISRFVTSWLARTQDKGGSNGKTQHQDKPGKFERTKQKIRDWEAAQSGTVIDGETVGQND